MKTVFTNAQMAHVWAQQTQPHGRSNSMKFDGSVGYSYQTPVAHIMLDVEGNRVLLIRENAWGQATGKHLSLYRDAVPASVPVFEVPNVIEHRYNSSDVGAEEHAANVRKLTADYTAHAAAVLKSPCDSYKVENVNEGGQLPTRAHLTLFGLAEVVAYYSACFALGLPALPWREDADKAISRRDRLLNDPKAMDKREKRRVANEERDAGLRENNRLRALARDADQRKHLAEWRAGAAMLYFHCADERGGAYCRIVGDELQTSRGAHAPMRDVVDALDLWRHFVTTGLTYNYNPGTGELPIELGHFRVDSIDAAGNVIAGCHTFFRDELEALDVLAMAWRAADRTRRGLES